LGAENFPPWAAPDFYHQEVTMQKWILYMDGITWLLVARFTDPFCDLFSHLAVGTNQ